jgi:hypothetical protein
MHRLHDLRLIRQRPVPARDRAAKVIALEARRAEKLERLQKLQQPTRPDAA